jgi:hypothetical protein
LPAGNTAIELQNRDPLTNQTSFDTTYPTGNYTFNLFTLDNGNKFPVLNLPTPVYPSTPRVSNYSAAQTINPASSFLLQWDAFAGGTTNETIWCIIIDGNGNWVFSTPRPLTDLANALKGTATSVTIPAGTLQLGSNYLGTLIFSRIMSTNTTGYPGAVGVTSASAETTFAMATTAPLQATTASLPNGTNGTAYNFSLAASGGQPPYSWSVTPGYAGPPGNLTLNPNGTITGTPTNTGTFYFEARVTDVAASFADSSLLSLTVVNPPLQPLTMTTASLPNAQQGAVYTNQLQAAGGQLPYVWSLSPGSLSLPPNLNLSTNGVISGTSATNGTFFFIARVTDANSTFVNRSLGLTINPKPTLTGLTRAGNQFQLRLNGTTGQTYTVQYSTNLGNTNWLSLLTTNPSAAAVTILDPNATNAARFYRARVGP